MLIKILLVIAIVIQCVATGYALRLVRTTKYNSVWILFIVGFSLLSVERLIQLSRSNASSSCFSYRASRSFPAGGSVIWGS